MSGRRPIEILLIEDNPGDVRLAEEAFREAQADVRLRWVTTVDAAMRALRPGPSARLVELDLVLLDLQLPRKDGRQFLTEFRAQAEWSDVPVVVLTSSSSDDDKLWVSRFEKSWFYTKPMDMDAFVEVARRILSLSGRDALPAFVASVQESTGFAG